MALPSVAAFDGYLASSSIRNTVIELLVGDEESIASNRDFRSFLAFNLNAIPAGAQITSAILRIYQTRVSGAPYGQLGVVLVNHVDIGAAIDAADYNAAVLSAAGTLSTTATVGWKELDVTAGVQADRAAPRAQSQFRIQFSMADQNNDGNDTACYFESGDDSVGTGNVPLLVVTYSVP